MNSDRIAMQIAEIQAIASANWQMQMAQKNMLQQSMLQQSMLQQNMLQQSMPVPEIEVSSEDELEEDDEIERTLFCGGLDERVTEELLYELFIHAGPLEKVHLPKDNTGRQRAFGFVTYVHKCTIPYAMRLYKGVSLFRKSITIKYHNSMNMPPLERILLPEDPEIAERRKNYENATLRGSNRGAFYDDTAQISASLLRCGADDWMKGSAGRIVIKEPPQKHGGSYMRSHNYNAPYQRNDSNRHRNHQSNNWNNRRSEQRNSGGHRKF